MILFERFSSRGLAGAYVDVLATDGVIATVAFQPRRHPDPQPFIVNRLQSPSAVSCALPAGGESRTGRGWSFG